MSLKTSINRFRRKIMKSLTESIGSRNNELHWIENPKRILVVRPNHRLGNQLLLTPLVAELQALFPNAKIDLWVRGQAARQIFKLFANVDRIVSLPAKPFRSLARYVGLWIELPFHQYDLVVNAAAGSSSGKIATRVASSPNKLYGFMGSDVSAHHAIAPVLELRTSLKEAGILPMQREVPPMTLMLSDGELMNGKRLLADMSGDAHVIALFTYATGNKRYDSHWWQVLAAKLKENFPEHSILEVLPVENTSAFHFSLPHYYSKAIREIASVLANAAVFIGADSGMMHLAEAAHVPTIGLFKVTDPKKYGPYGIGSHVVDTRHQSQDDLIDILKKQLMPPSTRSTHRYA